MTSNFLILFSIVFVICAPAWLMAFFLYKFWQSFNVAHQVKEKILLREKKAVVPDVIPELDMASINERLDTALALRRESEVVESHVSGLGKEVVLDSEDHSSAISKLRNIGK